MGKVVLDFLGHVQTLGSFHILLWTILRIR